MRHPLLAAATVSSLLVLGTGHARATAYTFRPVGPSAPDPSWTTFSTVHGLNNLGHVVGSYQGVKWGGDHQVNSYWYVQTKSGVVPFSVPGAESMNVSGINDAGHIVGTYLQAASYPYRKSFLTAGDVTRDISVPGAIATYAEDVNKLGQVVGTYYDSQYDERTFLYSDGAYTTLDLSRRAGTYAQGINDAGDVVGYITVEEGYRVRDRGFYYSKGVFRVVNVPMASHTYVTDINNLGQMVGYYQGARDGMLHGFIFSAATGEFTYIDAPEKMSPGPRGGYYGAQTVLEGINDAGQIAGYSGDIYGHRGFVATPAASAVPEPPGLSVFGFGLIGAGLIRRGRGHDRPAAPRPAPPVAAAPAPGAGGPSLMGRSHPPGEDSPAGRSPSNATVRSTV